MLVTVPLTAEVDDVVEDPPKIEVAEAEVARPPKVGVAEVDKLPKVSVAEVVEAVPLKTEVAEVVTAFPPKIEGAMPAVGAEETPNVDEPNATPVPKGEDAAGAKLVEAPKLKFTALLGVVAFHAGLLAAAFPSACNSPQASQDVSKPQEERRTLQKKNNKKRTWSDSFSQPMHPLQGGALR